jgi:hypothetical protein
MPERQMQVAAAGKGVDVAGPLLVDVVDDPRLLGLAPAGGQFDFTATPRHSKGQLFSWTVFDYPLKQAITHRVAREPQSSAMLLTHSSLQSLKSKAL